MVRSDAEITEIVLKNCNTKFSEEIIKKISSNTQTSRLSTKYDMIQNAMIEKWNQENREYTTEELAINVSRAYIYAKIVSGKFLDIRPRVDSTEVLNTIILNYEEGYKYMVEALFMKLGSNNISNYVKGKIEGNIFYNKISGVTNSQPIQIKKERSNTDIMSINKIKNLIFQIRAKEDEYKWLNARIERKNTQKQNIVKENKYNYNYA